MEEVRPLSISCLWRSTAMRAAPCPSSSRGRPSQPWVRAATRVLFPQSTAPATAGRHTLSDAARSIYNGCPLPCHAAGVLQHGQASMTKIFFVKMTDTPCLLAQHVDSSREACHQSQLDRVFGQFLMRCWALLCSMWTNV